MTMDIRRVFEKNKQYSASKTVQKDRVFSNQKGPYHKVNFLK
jgi:hypothetical protein